MKYIIIALLLSFAALNDAAAQQSAVKFALTPFDGVLQKAASTGKPIFVYFGHEGCGCCMRTEREALADLAIGRFVNDNFIPWMVESDNEEGVQFAERWKITQHPTFMILDDHGRMLHKFVGKCGSEGFLSQLRIGLDPARGLGALQHQYADGRRDPEFLRMYIGRLREAGDLTAELINEYLATQDYKDLARYENIQYIYDYAVFNYKPSFTIDSNPFQFMLRNQALFAKYFDPEQVETRIVMTAYASAMAAANVQDSDLFHRSVDILQKFDQSKAYQLADNDGRISCVLKKPRLVRAAEINYYGKYNLGVGH
jgi:thioredoxin-related protein